MNCHLARTKLRPTSVTPQLVSTSSRACFFCFPSVTCHCGKICHQILQAKAFVIQRRKKLQMGPWNHTSDKLNTICWAVNSGWRHSIFLPKFLVNVWGQVKANKLPIMRVTGKRVHEVAAAEEKRRRRSKISAYADRTESLRRLTNIQKQIDTNLLYPNKELDSWPCRQSGCKFEHKISSCSTSANAVPRSLHVRRISATILAHSGQICSNMQRFRSLGLRNQSLQLQKPRCIYIYTTAFTIGPMSV